jgi:hypothetical protein
MNKREESEGADSARGANLPPGSPGGAAAYGALVFGVLIFGFGLWVLVGEKTTYPLAVALVITGFLQSVTGFYVLRRVRAAWAFASSLNGTAFVVLLFGAPRLREAADIAMGVALLPALAFGVLTLLYALAAEDL